MVCLVGIFSSSFPITILTIAVKPIADELGSVPTTISWVTTGPVLVGAVATPVLGRLGDLRGHRRLYLAGLSVAIAFSALTAIAWSASSLITFRTLSQLGATATVPATLRCCSVASLANSGCAPAPSHPRLSPAQPLSGSP